MPTLPTGLAPTLAVVTLALAGVLLAVEPTRTRARNLVRDYWIFAVFGTFSVIGVWLFFERDEGYFRELLREYWLYALFAIFILEGAMLLYFAPSESLIPIAIGLAESWGLGWPTYATVIGVSVVGATIGQYLLFLVAKRGGREYLLEKRWFRVSEERLDQFDGWFDRWGPLAVPVSNTLLFTRGMLTVPAGFAEMRDREFVLLSALGTLSFETLLALGTLGVLSFI